MAKYLFLKKKTLNIQNIWLIINQNDLLGFKARFYVMLSLLLFFNIFTILASFFLIFNNN